MTADYSFKIIGEHENVRVFYTCPAEAIKYDDTEGILSHYDTLLALQHPNPWIWIFSSQGFTMKHSLEIRTGIELTKLISEKYASSLQKLIVIHPTWYIRIMFNIIRPFMSEKLKNVIEIRA
jgi:hypothetical protein